MNVLCSDKTGTITEGMVQRALRRRHRWRPEREDPGLRLPERLLRNRLHQPHRRGASGRLQPGRLEVPGRWTKSPTILPEAPERARGRRDARTSSSPRVRWRRCWSLLPGRDADGKIVPIEEVQSRSRASLPGAEQQRLPDAGRGLQRRRRARRSSRRMTNRHDFPRFHRPLRPAKARHRRAPLKS